MDMNKKLREFEIIYSKRKSLCIQVLSDGNIVVRAPKGLSKTYILQFLQQKEVWIRKKQVDAVEQKKKQSAQLCQTYENGSILMLEGAEIELIIKRLPVIKKCSVRLEGEELLLELPEASSVMIKDILVSWYKSFARQKLKERADYYKKIIGCDYHEIRVKDQKSRFGSCSTLGNLNFNWRCILAPPEILNYVVVHELCHRKQMNHSKYFWKEVENILPDYREQKKWLKEQGSCLEM